MRLPNYFAQTFGWWQWPLLLGSLSGIIGSLCAGFLLLLQWAQESRHHLPWLLFLLPLAGMLIAYLYERWGSGAKSGMAGLQSSVENESAEPAVSRRITPLIIITTALTHFFGGSAGREGTAVQMGAGVGASLSRLPRLHASPNAIRILVVTGMAAGFSGLFGTPWAALIFSLEISRLKGLRWQCAITATICSWGSYIICHMWGAIHAPYPEILTSENLDLSPWSPSILMWTCVVGIASALAARLYLYLHDFVQWSLRGIRVIWRPAIGGCFIIGLVLLTDDRSYLGLGVTAEDPHYVTIIGSFEDGTTGHDSWLWKTLFTAITLGSGFKGGEVTPLFFIGATLGHSLAAVGGASVAICAGLGMVGLFAAASRAPLACAIMGAELFGWESLPLTLLCCGIACLLARKKGIYSARLSEDKTPAGVESTQTP